MSLLRLAVIIPGISVLVIACTPLQQVQQVNPTSIINTYIEIAQASYQDSFISAQTLDRAIDNLLESPSQQNLGNARAAWISARVPYQQTEVYRFGNSIVDDWEVRVNAWPLDEGLIDYTATSYGEESDNNIFYTANIIANETLNIGGIRVDATVITPGLLSDTLQEIDGVESNVATGYHAIEFLLWGQDLNGTNPGAGNRPFTDFSLQNCSNDNCDRRRDYLKAASVLLLSDLEEMFENWREGGAAYIDLKAKGENGGLQTILIGMGSLAFGELAGDRIRLGLLLHDPEEEHDCFSDNTHMSHFYNAKGINNVYLGEYQGIKGNIIRGPSIAALLADIAPELANEMANSLSETEQALSVLLEQAQIGNTFDVLIGADSPNGNAIITRILDSLVEETASIEKIVVALGLD